MVRSHAVQGCGFGVFEIKQAQDGIGTAASSSGVGLCFMIGGLHAIDQ
jgi:hypothetical protein